MARHPWTNGVPGGNARDFPRRVIRFRTVSRKSRSVAHSKRSGRGWVTKKLQGSSPRFSSIIRTRCPASVSVFDANCVAHSFVSSGGPAVLLELVGAIGTWTMVSGVLRTLEVPLEDDLASWPPDGRKP